MLVKIATQRVRRVVAEGIDKTPEVEVDVRAVAVFICLGVYKVWYVVRFVVLGEERRISETSRGADWYGQGALRPYGFGPKRTLKQQDLTKR